MKIKEIKERTPIKVDSPTLNYVKTEVNFLIYPIGSVTNSRKQGKIIFTECITDGNIKKEIKWEVIESNKHGIPSASAIETDLAITKIINDTGWPVPRMIETSIYQILKTRGLPLEGSGTWKQIKKDLKSLAATSYETWSAFKCKWEKKPNSYIEGIIRKYDAIIFRGTLVPGKYREYVECSKTGRAEKTYIILSDIYRQSLNSYYTKKIDFDYMMSLKGAFIKRLYLLLNFAFATRLNEDNKTVSYPYIELCSRIPIVIQKYISRAKERLNGALDYLVEEGYLSKYEWVNEDKANKHWKLEFKPGGKAISELLEDKNQMTLPMEDSSFENKNETMIVDIFLTGFEKARLADRKEIQQAKKLLQRHDTETSLHIIHYAINKIKKTFKESPERFGSILLYEQEALDDYKKCLLNKSIQADHDARMYEKEELSNKEAIDSEKAVNKIGLSYDSKKGVKIGDKDKTVYIDNLNRTDIEDKLKDVIRFAISAKLLYKLD